MGCLHARIPFKAQCKIFRVGNYFWENSWSYPTLCPRWRISKNSIYGAFSWWMFLLSYLSSDSWFQKFHSMFSHWIFDIEIHSVAGCISAGDFVWPKDSEDWNRFKEISTLFPYHLWHSEDDTIVPFSDAICIHQKSENCILHPFNDRFHFVGPDFTELSREIFCWT